MGFFNGPINFVSDLELNRFLENRTGESKGVEFPVFTARVNVWRGGAPLRCAGITPELSHNEIAAMFRMPLAIRWSKRFDEPRPTTPKL
jgi:hypothetical protein